MKPTRTAQTPINQTGQNLIRILIASYFIAVSLGLINGTGGDVFAAQVLPEPTATYAGNALVFVLGYLVLTGFFLRPAALMLAVVVFWSSYFTHLGPEGPMAISEFWRDIALIGALMMSYVHSTPRSLRQAAMFRLKPRVRKIKPTDGPVAPRRVAATTSIREQVTPIKKRIEQPADARFTPMAEHHVAAKTESRMIATHPHSASLGDARSVQVNARLAAPTAGSTDNIFRDDLSIAAVS